MSVPYLGSRITLLSQAEVRYIGTLFTIDSEKSQVVLTNGACACALGLKMRGVAVRGQGSACV